MTQILHAGQHSTVPGPDVSIVIRVRNEEKTLPHTLGAVFEQKFAGTFEVIIVDNESTDRSLQIAQSFPTRLVHIARNEFTYGRALNMGCEASRGEFIVFLSADAVPMGRYWLQTLIDYCDQPGIAACSGVEGWQLPNLTSGFRPTLLDAETCEALEHQGKELPEWHAVSSALRREVWLKHEFNQELPMGEDKEWSYRVARSGWKLATGVPAVAAHEAHRSAGLRRGLRRLYWGRFGAVVVLGGNETRTTLPRVLAGCALETVKLARRFLKSLTKHWIRSIYLWDATRQAERSLKGKRAPYFPRLRPERTDGQPRSFAIARKTETGR